MAMALTNLSRWLWSGKSEEPCVLNDSSLNAHTDLDLWESETFRFPLVQGANMASSSKKGKRKWHIREERKIDKEFDVVIVPSDGVCVSGSESDGSDYSIGWLETHGPGFQRNEDTDDSFAVLVPCYGRVNENANHSKNTILGAVLKVPDGHYEESKDHMEQWLSSLQNIGN